MKFLISLIASAIVFSAPAIASAQAAPSSPAPAASPAASPSPSPTPTPKAFQFSGFGDVGITSSSASTGVSNTAGNISGGGLISNRVFDTVDKRPQFHNLNLQAAYTGPIGGKLELSFGDDADVINSYPKFGTQSSVDVTQAYISFTQGKFTLIGGKFETLAGAEVIESPSNLNFSRSFLFGLAVPFTHTGGRLTYAANDKLSLIAGLNKGWDTTKTISSNGDNNRLTTELGLAFNPTSAFSLTAQGYNGTVAVADPAANRKRSLVDIVGTYHFNPNVEAVINFDSGSETNFALSTGGIGTASWNGIAGYISDNITPKLSATLRAETFTDKGGSRTGTDQLLKEATLTFAYTLNPNVILRLEGRKDHSSQSTFALSNGLTRTYNDTIGFETLVKFP